MSGPKPSIRGGAGLLGLLCVLGLIGLAVFVPPDGHERGELAQFLGSFHPLAVHLPITLLLLVPILEIAGGSRERRRLQAAAGFVLGLAALSAIATPYLGWLLAWSGGFEGRYVTQHMWGGVSIAVATLLCWMLRRRPVADPSPGREQSSRDALRGPYVGMLTVTVLILAWTGYRGGQLGHGENNLTQHMPATLKAWLGLPAVRKGGASDRRATFYSARIAPIFEEHCLLCHSANKHKGGLRLDSYEHLLAGGKDGVVIKAGDAEESELFRRVSLDPESKDFMPAEGQPLMDEERKLLELWINAGASPLVGVEAIAGAPGMKKVSEPLAPDYRPQQQTIAGLEASLGLRLVPRSQNPSDGLVLRTASAPARCDDAALATLAPVGRYIVEAELARTRVTDAGLNALAGFENLHWVDLSHTAITSAALKELSKLPKLETLNLTGTRVDDTGLSALRKHSSLKHLYVFQTSVTNDPLGSDSQ